MLSDISLLALGLLTVSTGVVATGPSPVNLGTFGNFAILAETGVSTVPPSAITGDIGLSPAGGTFLTGFALTLDPTGTFSTSAQVTGKLFAASYTSPTPSTLTTAISNCEAAYLDGSGRTNPDFLDLYNGAIGNKTLAPGLYKWTTGVTVGLDAIISGSATDTWIFQVGGTFGMTGGKQITLAGGALAKNVFWAVADTVTLGPGAHLEGIVLGKTSATYQTGSTANGRVCAQTLVALQSATIVAPP